jgi:imidazolonepropionase-like amidohydrolase
VVYEGGYGGLAGVTKKVSTPAEAREAVDREAARDVDVVKLWLDSELDTMPRMPADISKAVIDEAHVKGLRAVAHIFYMADAKRMIEQGIDGLTHSVRDQPVDKAFVRAMKGKGTWQMAATLARERALFIYAAPAPWLNDPFFRAAASPATLDLLADPENQAKIVASAHFSELGDFLHTAQRNLKAIADAGVPYAMGTDAGGPLRFAGFSEHDELTLMVEAGLTPMQAIVAATSSGARFLGNGDIGSLEAGNWADMIVLNQNPLVDIQNSRSIAAVYIAGRQVPSVTGQGR